MDSDSKMLREEYLYGLGMAHDPVGEVSGTPAVFLPAGYEVKLFPELRESPSRVKRLVELQTLESFVDYVSRFCESSTSVFIDEKREMLSAVLDYHDSDSGSAGWCEHVARYRFPRSRELSAWSGMNGKKVGQEDFALFIERNAKDILVPSPAEMIEVSRTLSAKKDVAFKSGVRLDNGCVDFQYSEEIKGSAGVNGKLVIPEQFTIGVRVFMGGEGYKMPVKLRYRIDESRLLLWFDMIELENVVEKAFAEAVEALNRLLNEADCSPAIYRASIGD